jgi:anti-sigma factor RsiW
MRCSKLANGIESYLGGTLTPAKKKAFDRHLEGCQKCRDELARCKSENVLYRQTLDAQRLQGSVRSAVLSRLKHAYTAIRRQVEAQPKKALWIAPLAAAAQFLIVFWLSGTLFLGAAPARMDVFSVPGGKIVSVEWVRRASPYRYSSVKRVQALPGPGIADKEAKVD